MNKLYASFLLIATLFLFSCKKNETQLQSVQIRIVNTTDATLTNAILGKTAFGTIMPKQISYYVACSNVRIPQLTFYTNKALIQLSIGYCGTPAYQAPGLLENGKYIFAVIKDSLNAHGFGFTFTKQ